MANIVLVVLAASLAAVAAYHGADLPKGPFCGSSSNVALQCCRDRQDHCSHPIRDTICYCDEFCKRDRPYDDCCPDYESVCLNETEVPAESYTVGCQHNGKFYLPGGERTENCNQCLCVTDPVTYRTEWRCSQDPCIISDDIIYNVNRQGAGWRAYNYTQFFGKKLKDGMIYKLGTFELSYQSKNMVPIEPPKKGTVYRSTFDARKAWPSFINPPRDQGWCGSDWAVTIADIASDRFAIYSKGAEKVRLSPQMLLSCNVRHQQGCQGGHLEGAWSYARIQGLVDEDCFPYKGNMTNCPFKKYGNLYDDGCRPVTPERTSRYMVSPPARLKGEEAMMAEIMNHGPIHATMIVYQDFFHYRDGVYRHIPGRYDYINGKHSVRVLGWGEERGTKYWLVANSWGEEWGDNGYFRIARGVNESGIEDFVVTFMTEVSTAYLRK